MIIGMFLQTEPSCDSNSKAISIESAFNRALIKACQHYCCWVAWRSLELGSQIWTRFPIQSTTAFSDNLQQLNPNKSMTTDNVGHRYEMVLYQDGGKFWIWSNIKFPILIIEKFNHSCFKYEEKQHIRCYLSWIRWWTIASVVEVSKDHRWM